MKLRWRIPVAAALIAAGLAGVTTAVSRAAGQDGEPSGGAAPPLEDSLFIRQPPVVQPSWRDRLEAMKGVTRYRIFELRLPPVLPKSLDRIRIRPFPDVEMVAQSQRVYVRGPRDFSWFGSIEGERGARVGVTYRDGAVAGSLAAGGRYYRLVNLAKGVYAIAEYPTEPAVRCGNGLEEGEQSVADARGPGLSGPGLPEGAASNAAVSRGGAR